MLGTGVFCGSDRHEQLPSIRSIMERAGQNAGPASRLTYVFVSAASTAWSAADLFRRLLARRPDVGKPVGFRSGNGGADHVPRLVRRPRPAAVHGGAVVPHD